MWSLLKVLSLSCSLSAWVAQLVKHLTSAQVMISWFVGSSPASSSALTAQNLESAVDSVSPSLSLPLPHSHSASFSLKNKHFFKKLRFSFCPCPFMCTRYHSKQKNKKQKHTKTKHTHTHTPQKQKIHPVTGCCYLTNDLAAQSNKHLSPTASVGQQFRSQLTEWLWFRVPC